MSWRRLALAAWLAGAASCAPLPAIDHDVCGNAVIDDGEDCDTFPLYGSQCRQRGEVGACHLDCSRKEDGERAPCPEGWGCGIDAICQRPTPEFEEPLAFETGSELRLMSGDFDGDGRDDLVGQEKFDAEQRTRVRFHYFDESGRLEDTRAFPKTLRAPVIAELSGDARSDVLFSDPRLGLLLGSADRSWVPEAFGSYRVQDHGLRIFGLFANEGAPVVALSTLDDTTGLFIPIEEEGLLRRVLTLPKGIEALVGDPVMGNVIEGDLSSPCDEAVFAYSGASVFSVVDLCTRDATGLPLNFRHEAVQTDVALDPPAPIDHAPLLVDVDGDGHLDALIGAGGITYLAPGDGAALGTATPYTWRWTEVHSPTNTAPRTLESHEDRMPMPLAAADLSADGVIDFVFSAALMVSVPGVAAKFPIYRKDYEAFGSPWTEAKIGDLNRDGKLDVVTVASGRLDIDFFNGTRSEHLPHVSIATQSPASHLSLGDFDGDGVDDVAFAEKANAAGELDSVEIAFGSPAGAPSEPKRVAHVEGVEQIGTLRTTSICNLMVTSLDHHDGEQTGVLMLFDGSADRIPLAAYDLTNFSRTGSLNTRGVFGLSAGSFTAPQRRDVIALATQIDSGISVDSIWEFWLMPSIDASESIAESLSTTLAPQLQPVLRVNGSDRLSLASAAADLDGDGVSEALFAMPTRDGQGCGLVTLGDRDAHFTEPRYILLDEPCPEPLLGASDADGDGAADVLLLVGSTGSAERRLLSFWNDGTGNFTSSDFSVVSEPGDAPRQFTVLPPSLVRGFSIAYITETAVKLRERLPARHDFAPAVTVAKTQGGSGLVSGDLDGDGVIDLALAETHTIAVLRAKLGAP